MKPFRLQLVLSLALMCFLLASGRAWAWPQLTPEQRAFKAVPGIPDAPAVILYHEVTSNDNHGFEAHTFRIKILTQAGKKYGDISIPYRKGPFSITGIAARTILPDGTVVPFKGKVLDQLVAQKNGARVYKKVFAMPDVEPGCIIDYTYAYAWDTDWLYSTYWNVQKDLYTVHSYFDYVPYSGDSGFQIYWVTHQLPKGLAPKRVHGTHKYEIRMTADNIAPYITEDDMPPLRSLVAGVHFFYSDKVGLTNVKDFWKRQDKAWLKQANRFIGKTDKLRGQADKITAGSTSQQDKLHKLYDYVQSLKNLSYPPHADAITGKPPFRNGSASDALSHGGGTRNDLNLLLAGLAQAEDIPVTLARSSSRYDDFFATTVADPKGLDAYIDLVSVNGQQLAFDPGTPGCPFGLLPWYRSGSPMLVLDKDGGKFAVSPLPQDNETAVQRGGKLTLGEDGSLQGTVNVKLSGEEAFNWRFDTRDDDAATRQRELLKWVRHWFPNNADVQLNGAVNWNAVEQPLAFAVNIKLPYFAQNAGSHVLVPVDPFEMFEKARLQNPARTYSFYFDYPSATIDDVDFVLPRDFNLTALPKGATLQQHFIQYQLRTSAQGNVIHVHRMAGSNCEIIPAKFHDVFRQYFGMVKHNDQQRILLARAATVAAN